LTTAYITQVTQQERQLTKGEQHEQEILEKSIELTSQLAYKHLQIEIPSFDLLYAMKEAQNAFRSVHGGVKLRASALRYTHPLIGISRAYERPSFWLKLYLV
jgi:hypothetical protein